LSVERIKIKEKKPGQRACDEKDAKGKFCVGHLKRWDTPTADVVQQVGKNAELYRCERCHTLYQPVAEDRSSAGLRYEKRPVNIIGDFSRRA
jgi:hypothetical protein